MRQTIVITGATGKIGRVLTRHFVSSGDAVIAIGRSADKLRALAGEMLPLAGTLRVLEVDLMDNSAAAAVADQLTQTGTMPTGLVNNARNLDFLKVGDKGCIDREAFTNEFVLDVVVPYQLTMALANADAARLSSVVNIGSQYGSVAPTLHLYDNPEQQSPLHYGVAKAAMAHLTKELAVRLADRGIRVNCVAFGGVEGRSDAGFAHRYASLCPIGRMLREGDLPGPVEFLLSDAAGAITGHTMMVDGGWSVW